MEYCRNSNHFPKNKIGKWWMACILDKYNSSKWNKCYFPRWTYIISYNRSCSIKRNKYNS